jgi:hypothetical protein
VQGEIVGRAIQNELAAPPYNALSARLGKELSVKWETARDVRVEGVACAWLINRFIDDEAEIGFVPMEEVLSVAEREAGTAFALPVVTSAPAEGLSSFELLARRHSLVAPGLELLGRIVRAASNPQDGEPDQPQEAPGLRAIAEGFALVTESDIERQQLQWPLYDALLEWCAGQSA